MVLNLRKIIKSQKGIIFGMDARITLMVTAIMLLVVGVNQIGAWSKNATLEANTDLSLIQIALQTYYQDNYSVPTIDTLLTEYYVQLDDNVNSDPWGNTYTVWSLTESTSLQGLTFAVKYITLISAGPDGGVDTTEPTTKAEWESLTASDDDILLTFSTLDREKEIAEIEYNQLQIIQFALEAFVKNQTQTNATYCDVLGNQLTVYCDVDQNGTYIENEEAGLNYLPKEKDESVATYYDDVNFYKSGYTGLLDSQVNYANGMYALLEALGIDPTLSETPRGLVLNYNSNQYGNSQSPYFGQIWYDSEVTIY